MNTKNKKPKVDCDREPRARFIYSGFGDNFTQFFTTMNSVNLNSPTSKLNETSISDNRGGRIELNQDDIIKK